MVIKALMVVDHNGHLPLAQMDILGASALERMTDTLAAEVSAITVVAAESAADAPQFRAPAIRYKKAAAGKLWEEARALFQELRDADAVLLARLSAYSEIEWSRFFAHHRANGRVTRAWAGPAHPLDLYMVDPRFEKECDFLLHGRLRRARLETGKYFAAENEYTHPLANAGDLREIAEDALNLRCLLRPVGREVRPGIWMDEHAHVDEGVRLVAPAFVGKFARVRTGAVITRGSAVERYASVDCGTVVENSSVLPFATVGAGLDLSRAVVGGKRVYDLKRRVEVAIEDPTLVSEQAHNAGLRLLSKAASLATYLPMQFWRGMTDRRALEPETCTSDAPTGVIQPNIPAAGSRLRPELVMERYGNQ